MLAWKPDLVTIYFGWNDHWLARDFADKAQQQRLPLAVQFRNAADHSRIIQLMSSAAGSLLPPHRPGLRVELPDYRANLLAMHDSMSGINGKIWYLTASHAMDLGIPDYLMTSGEVDDPALLVSLHRQFNGVVREVARDTASPAIDLEAETDAEDKQALFVEDHIHLTEAGRQFVAQRLVQELRKQGLLTTESPNDIR